MKEYLNIIIFLTIAVVLAMVLLILSNFLIQKNTDLEKNSAYECGFDPFDDARGRFDVRFYLVAILFIVFDLEVSFLFPWALCLDIIGPVGFFGMLLFLLVLTLGFVYEWQKGALEWE